MLSAFNHTQNVLPSVLTFRFVFAVLLIPYFNVLSVIFIAFNLVMAPTVSVLMHFVTYLLLIPPDIDECSTNNHSCDVNAFCNNTSGSHRCTCRSGYFGDGQVCTGKNHFVCLFCHASILFVCLFVFFFFCNAMPLATRIFFPYSL